jgi:hypothetical protein
MEELDLFKLTLQVIDLFKYQAQPKSIVLELHLDKGFHNLFSQIPSD